MWIAIQLFVLILIAPIKTKFSFEQYTGKDVVFFIFKYLQDLDINILRIETFSIANFLVEEKVV